MKNEAKKTQQVAKTEQNVNVTEENVMEQIRSKGIGGESIAQKVEQRLKEEQDERLIEETKRAVCKAQYTNLKALLQLRMRRREEAATKQYLKDTKELLDNLTGYKNEKGEFVNPTLTNYQYEEKRREATKKMRDAFRDSENQYDSELAELKAQYPGYYCYDWER